MSDPAIRRILIVVSSMATGGPQKSLIGLLERLDGKRFAVDLMVMNGRPGALSRWVPAHVHLLHTPGSISAAVLPRQWFVRNLISLLFNVRPSTAIAVFRQMINGSRRRDGWQQVRQRVWRAVRRDLPPLREHYDAAFGILGLSTYCVVDLVDADFKYHWIRSDTRILGRDEEIDGEYYKHLTGAVSVSDQCSEIFQALYPSARGRVVVYKNDIPTFRGDDGPDAHGPLPVGVEHVLLTVARLDRLKGIDLAIEACGELVARGHNVGWIVAGEGPERARLEQLISKHDLARRFILLGNVLDTSPYLDVADVYVHPSRTEGRSNSVEEARASALPIVATAYETVADQVDDGVTGVVCSIDSHELANSIERLLRDPDAASQLGQAAKDAYDSEIVDPNALMYWLSRGTLSLETDGTQ